MADETTTSKAPKTVEMPRAVHQLRTGPKEADVVEPGTIITDDIAKKHKLSDATIKDLIDRGAIDEVEVQVLTA